MTPDKSEEKNNGTTVGVSSPRAVAHQHTDQGTNTDIEGTNFTELTLAKDPFLLEDDAEPETKHNVSSCDCEDLVDAL